MNFRRSFPEIRCQACLSPVYPDKPDMNFWLTLPEIRCQACLSPVYLPELSDQLQPFEILIRPMRLDLDHRPQCLDFECLAGPVK
jgi:hypothetical protein